MHRFIEWLKGYLFRKAVADAVAILVLCAVWVFLSGALLLAFDGNSIWISKVWGFIYPYMDTRIQLASDAVSKAHEAVLAGLRLANGVMSKALGEESSVATQLEATARILLIGEAWILKVQLSWLFRGLHWAWRG